MPSSMRNSRRQGLQRSLPSTSSSALWQAGQAKMSSSSGPMRGVGRSGIGSLLGSRSSQRCGEVDGAGAARGGDVMRIRDAAAPQGEAAAPDAGVEPVTQCRQRPDLLVEALLPHLGDASPVGTRRVSGLRQRGEDVAHLLERQTDVARRPDESQTSQHAALVAALATAGSVRMQKALAFIEAKSRGCEAAALSELTDSEQIGTVHRRQCSEDLTSS